jgi:hypothetical protein
VNYSATAPDLLRVAEPADIGTEAVNLFLDRWGRRGASDGWWNHRLVGLADPYEPFIAELPSFLSAHVGHRLQAQQLAEGPR